MEKLIADQTSAVMDRAAPALDALWDYEMTGTGMPGTLMQLEAFYSVTPDNEVMALLLAKAYTGYALGWVESEHEKAYAAGDFDASDHQRHRARLFYLRARDLALRVMRNRDDELDAAMKSNDLGALAQYLKDVYSEPEDAAPLFWAGMAWGAAINVSLDQPDLLADLPTVRALVERAMELDDMFYVGGAYLFLGSLNSALSPALGGDPKKGTHFFEEGLKKTGRRNHMMHVNYARLYAVNTQNRELYHKLLMEVVSAPDQGNDVRLMNKIARERAERYLAEEDDLF